jgi:phage-related protein
MVSGTYTTVRGKMTTWANDVKSTFEGTGSNKLSERFRTIASNVVSGFSGGITDFLKDSIDTVKNWAGSVVSAVKDKLGIHSPSKAFAKLGEYTVAGFNESIDKYGSSTSDVMQDWVDSFSDMSIKVGVGLSVDDSELSKLKNDYGFNRQMDINAMADYMNESLQANNGNDQQIELLREQNELLQQILDKDISVSGDEVFSTVRRKANDYFRVNREPAFEF